jgi:hypothetical protein
MQRRPYFIYISILLVLYVKIFYLMSIFLIDFLSLMDGRCKRSIIGYPKKAAQAIINVVESPNPPPRLPLGNDAYQVAVNKFSNLLTQIEEQKTIAAGADFSKP